MSENLPQTWPALAAWLLNRLPGLFAGAIVLLYFGFVLSLLLRGSAFIDAVDPRNFIGRDCLQLSEQAGKVFQIDQCRGTVTELESPPR